LKKVDSKLSKECSAFIGLQDVCKKDIEAHCAGKEYSGDLIVCLSEWVRNILYQLFYFIFLLITFLNLFQRVVSFHELISF
jgi:Cysteine rich repeat